MSLDDFLWWQERRQDARQGRRRDPNREAPVPEKQPGGGGWVGVTEHTATTSKIRLIREAVARKFRGE